MAQNGIRIGQLAKMLDTTTKTLRFYEGIGLLDPPLRSASAYRLYDDPAVAKARLVIDLRRLGLTTHELQELLSEDHQITRRQRLLALMDEKLREMYLQLSILQGRCDDLSARHEALLATPRDRPPECICDALFRPCTCR
jgi:DNA-binding transcriptional MerR regulator